MANWKEIAFKSDVTGQFRTLNFTNSSFYVKGISKKASSGGAAGGEYGYMYFTPLGSNSTSTPLALTLSSASDANDGDIKNLVDGVDATGSDTSSAYFTLDYNETVSGATPSTQTGWLKGVLNCSMDVPYGDAANKSHHFNISTTVCNETGSNAHTSYRTHFSLWRAYVKDADLLSSVTFYKVQNLIRANNAGNTYNEIMYAPYNSSRLRHYRAEPFDVPVQVGSLQDEHTCLYVLGVIFTTSTSHSSDSTINNSLGTQDWPADDQAASIKTQTIVNYVPASWTAP